MLFVVEETSILLAGPHPANSSRIELMAVDASMPGLGGVVSVACGVVSVAACAWRSYNSMLKGLTHQPKCVRLPPSGRLTVMSAGKPPNKQD